jgi:hypothetical protein
VLALPCCVIFCAEDCAPRTHNRWLSVTLPRAEHSPAPEQFRPAAVLAWPGRVGKAVVSLGLSAGRHPCSVFASLYDQVTAKYLGVGKAIYKLADSCIMMMLMIRVGRGLYSTSGMCDQFGTKSNNIPMSSISGAKVACSCLRKPPVCWMHGRRWHPGMAKQVRFPITPQCVSKTYNALDRLGIIVSSQCHCSFNLVTVWRG